MDLAALPRQLARTQRFTLGVPRAVTISSGGERVLFLRSRGGEDPVTCLWLLAADGTEHLLADPAVLSRGSDAGLPEAERIRRERGRELASGITAFSADSAGQVVAFALDGELWVCGPGTGAPRRLPAAGPVVDPRLDPAGRRVAYVTGGALHVTEVSDGTGRCLASPEHADVTYGLAEHVAAESMYRYRGHWWAPAGEQLLAARVDNSVVQQWWISDPANPASQPRAIRYPAAGTANADVSLHVLRLDGTRTEICWDRTAFEYLTRVSWDACGPLLSVQSRDQRTVRILAADPAGGSTSLLHEDHDDAWVELISGSPLRTGSGRLVLVADSGGSRRLVVDGSPVTPDGVQVREVLGADSETVWFAATREPTEEQVWRYDAAAGGPAVQVSRDPGVHTGQAGGGTVALLSHTGSGRSAVVTRPGRPAAAIACLDDEPLLIPRITWLSAGERQIRTALLLPSWYQEGTGPLPVLLSPYGGPAMQLVVRARTSAFCEDQWFADCGFAVVVADGRGTPGRGPAWDKTVHGDTLSAPLEDQVAALHAAAAHCPDLDLSRVAIRGWSYGGALAAIAVLRRPDVFRAAISGAAPHDQRLYDTHWRERFIGKPQDHPDAYARSSPITEAAALTRPLLLIHGMADDNVVVAHTLRMSAALLAAGRPHSVLPLSGATHMPRQEIAGMLLQHELDFLRESLGVPVPG
jgi:dipeptidyl-peptidase-4